SVGRSRVPAYHTPLLLGATLGSGGRRRRLDSFLLAPPPPCILVCRKADSTSPFVHGSRNMEVLHCLPPGGLCHRPDLRVTAKFARSSGLGGCVDANPCCHTSFRNSLLGCGDPFASRRWAPPTGCATAIRLIRMERHVATVACAP